MNITHDLATPLTAIAGLGESLVDGVNQSREDYEATGRLDFKLSSKDNFFGRYVYQKTFNGGVNFGNGIQVGDWQDVPGLSQQIGLDWWKYDQHLAPSRHAATLENQELKRQVRTLERQLARLTTGRVPLSGVPGRRRQGRPIR